MTILPALAFGFALGVKHATDADHVAAVGTLAAGRRSTRQAAALGALWGLGHSLSVLLAGGALVLLGTPMPHRIALGLEFLVALMLVGLGVRSFARPASTAQGSSVRPVVVGMVHGLAGSAVLALLLIGTASGPLAAVLYLVLFSAGTVAGMTAVTMLLCLPALLHPARAARVERWLRGTAGVASVAVGLLLAHRVGIEEGLFAASFTRGP